MRAPGRRHQSVPLLERDQPTPVAFRNQKAGVCPWDYRYITTPEPGLARQTHSNTTSCADGCGGPVQYGFRGSTVWPSLCPSGICLLRWDG